jgi:hypothetical protein
MKAFFGSFRLFLHLIPNAILILGAVSFVVIISVDIFQLGFPTASVRAERLNSFWVNLFYSLFTSVVFYVITFGTYDYKKAVTSAPYVIAKVREFIAYSIDELSGMCTTNNITFDRTKPPHPDTYVKVAEINPTSKSNVRIDGYQLTWNELLAHSNLKILELCDESIQNINSLNFPDHELLERLHFLKTSPHFGFMEGQAKYPREVQLNTLGMAVLFFENYITNIYRLETFINKYYEKYQLSIERPPFKNERLEEILKKTNLMGNINDP